MRASQLFGHHAERHRRAGREVRHDERELVVEQRVAVREASDHRRRRAARRHCGLDRAGERRNAGDSLRRDVVRCEVRPQRLASRDRIAERDDCSTGEHRCADRERTETVVQHPDRAGSPA